MTTENELPGKNARAMLPLLEELAEKDAEIERLRAVLRDLRGVVIELNRSGADWKTPELFARMMDALAKAEQGLG